MSEIMWTEKYRPRTLSEIVNQDEIKARLQVFVKNKNMPHCLFAGPPGTGKTTAALCLAHDLYGENYHEYFLELNASDERGINVVRETIKDFARARSFGDIPFKILVLDEADNMTSDAQQALRRTMELFTETCRFILICNYSGKIIEPIQSRCAIFRFTPLKDEDIKARLRYIAEQEKVKITEDALDTIVQLAEGDMRKAINLLQGTASLGKKVTPEDVYAVLGRVRPEDVSQMIHLALDGKFEEARRMLRNMMLRYGISGIDLVRQIHQEIFRLDVPETMKVAIADALGEVDFRISQGANEEIQLSYLLARICALGATT